MPHSDGLTDPEVESLESSALLVRNLRAEDLPALVRIDQRITGRSRRAWYEGRLRRALTDTDVNISLGAEVDGQLVGVVLGSVHYGEFGQPEPVAVLDTLLVDRYFGRKGVGRALMTQLTKNLQGLRVERLRTEVAWTEQELIGFLARVGFRPASRLVLELELGGS